MSTLEKLLQKIFANQQVSYEDAERILLRLGYELHIRGSHHGFRKADYAGIVLKRRSQLKQYQLKDLQEVLKKHGYQKKD